MTCTDGPRLDEAMFAVQLAIRGPKSYCVGHLITVTVTDDHLSALLRTFEGPSRVYVSVWEYAFPYRVSPDRVALDLCPAHWIDLMTTASLNDYDEDARWLFGLVCAGADWDRQRMIQLLDWEDTPLGEDAVG